MKNPEDRYWSKVIALFVVMAVLLVPVLIACGGDEDTEATTVSTTTQTATPTTASAGPVKIGILQSWSGPSAMAGIMYVDPAVKLIEWQMKQRGGILGGREVKIVKYDYGDSVAKAAAGVKKLVLEDKVSVVVGGGGGGTMDAIGTTAGELGVLYISLAELQGMLEGSTDLETTICGLVPSNAMYPIMADLILNGLEANTVGFLAMDDWAGRNATADIKRLTEEAGVKTVCEDYHALDISDFSPLLTRIKYKDPDVLVINFASQGHPPKIAKQIMELGGWGDIKVVTNPVGGAATTAFPGAQGWFTLVPWFPGSDYPESVRFVEDFQQVNGKMPDVYILYFYAPLLEAVRAIELAGTDTDLTKIAQIGRSGNLEVDTPYGLARWGEDGNNNLSYQVARIEGGKLVPYTGKESSAPAATAGPSTGTGLDINSTIGELVANERTAAVLDKWIPNFSTNPKLTAAYGMTMPTVAPMKPDIFTPEVMAGIEKDLAAIK